MQLPNCARNSSFTDNVLLRNMLQHFFSCYTQSWAKVIIFSFYCQSNLSVLFDGYCVRWTVTNKQSVNYLVFLLRPLQWCTAEVWIIVAGHSLDGGIICREWFFCEGSRRLRPFVTVVTQVLDEKSGKHSRSSWFIWINNILDISHII